MLTYAKYALLGLGAAIFLFFTTRSLRRREAETIDEPVWLRELEAPMSLSQLGREGSAQPVAGDGGDGAASDQRPWQRP